MKVKGLILISAVLISNLAYANIVIRTPAGAPLDICSQLPGAWTGSGSVSGGVINCTYTGSANVTAGQGESFNMDIQLNKKSGSILCPAHQELPLSGNCDNGVLTIDDSNTNLNGSMSSDGQSASLAGKVTFAGMTLEVKNLDLNKQ